MFIKYRVVEAIRYDSSCTVECFLENACQWFVDFVESGKIVLFDGGCVIVNGGSTVSVRDGDYIVFETFDGKVIVRPVGAEIFENLYRYIEELPEVLK